MYQLFRLNYGKPEKVISTQQHTQNALENIINSNRNGNTVLLESM